MKLCSKCKIHKAYTEYSKYKKSKDGLQPYCKKCYSAYRLLWRSNGGKEKESLWLNTTEKGKTLKDKIHANYRESGKRKVYNRERQLKAKLTGSFTKLEFEATKEKYFNRCACCGSSDNLCADHIVSLAHGGVNTINNIQPLCTQCNTIKSSASIDFRIYWSIVYKIL